jgi:hypothetical protein
MCGCSQGSSIYSQPQQPRQNRSVNTDCEFNESIINNWKLKLECVKEKELYQEINSSQKEINSFIGVVISALSNPENICYFAGHLQAISPTIIKIINTGQC